MRLRVSHDWNFIPRKNKIQIINIYLHNIKQCNLNIYTSFYYMDAIQSNLTYVLFYNVFIIKVNISNLFIKQQLKI